MAAPNPTRRKVSDIKSVLLKPALTSHFEVYITAPTNAGSFFRDNGAPYTNDGKLTLLCSDATLPGSSLASHESNNDFHGTTERFAYRRIYDDRIDLSFYVDSRDYYTIRFFETWIKFIANEQIREGSRGENYFYRFNYPDGNGGYREGSSLYVSKFERDYKQKLVYEFVKPYPISVQSIPISYESSSLLKCTVSMTYIRYVIDPNGSVAPISEPGQSSANGVPNSPFNLTPEQQAFFNQSFFNNSSLNQFNISSGSLTNSFGEGEEIINAINSRQTQVESGLPYVGRNIGPLAPL